jgi:hypothetical protein
LRRSAPVGAAAPSPADTSKERTIVDAMELKNRR